MSLSVSPTILPNGGYQIKITNNGTEPLHSLTAEISTGGTRFIPSLAAGASETWFAHDVARGTLFIRNSQSSAPIHTQVLP